VVTWELSRSQSASTGVERTQDFSQAWGTVRGESTYFETSVSVGFTASASGGLFGIGVGAETSVDNTFTSGTTRSFELSQTSTNAVGRATSNAIENGEAITCSQTCGPNPEDPSDIQGFIYNWVDAVYEEQTGEILHYIRTCASWCKYDNTPPICPPGFCFNRECTICQPDSFKLAELDALASSTAAPTMTPTVAPPLPAPSPPGCFSGSTEVVVRGEGAVAMEDLQAGHFVKIGNGEVYEQVYAFGHRVPERYTEFVQLHTNVGTPLEMTREHLVFVDGKTNPVRADSIKVGDLLKSQDNDAVVQKIELVHKNGIYNPLTASGTIQVNGIAASTYISFQKENNEYVELRGGVQIPVSHHQLAHLAMAPFRFYCTTLSICDTNGANFGMPFYVSKEIDLVEWGKQQHIAVQLFVLALFLITCAVFSVADYRWLLLTLWALNKIRCRTNTKLSAKK